MQKQNFIKIWTLAIMLTLVLAGCQPTTTSTTPASSDNQTSTTTTQPVNQATGSQEVTQTPAVTTPPASQTVATDTTINTKTVTWNGNTYTFKQSCIGVIKKGNMFGDTSKQIPYCVGMNTLKLVDAKGVETKLSTTNAATDSDAPVLIDAQAIPGSKNGVALVSYQAETCTTTNDCGAGMPTNFVNMAIELTTHKIQELSNYPASGQAHWNSDGTKAIFIPDTCGGAGCEVASLIGYNLALDKVNESLTKDLAAGSSVSGQLNDASGMAVNYWKSITWNTTSKFTAYMVDTTGKTKTVTGSF